MRQLYKSAMIVARIALAIPLIISRITNRRFIATASVLLAVMVAPGAHADALPVLPSELFDYQYEQDVVSNTQNLDGNSADDFFSGGATLPTVSGGIASFAVGDLYRTDFGAGALASITRAQIPEDSAFTLEASLEITTTSGEGSAGTMAIFYRDQGDNSSSILTVAAGSVKYGPSNTLLATVDNTDGFHTYRLARESNGNVWVWRDLLMLNPGGLPLTETVLAGANGLFFGDAGTAWNGTFDMDYMRLDNDGAFAPIPEPSTWSLGLMGLAGIGVVVWRRKRGSWK